MIEVLIIIMSDNEEVELKKTKDDVLSVTEVSELINDTIKKRFPFSVKIKGVVSNLKLPNGNLFMSLKDTSSTINVVFWNFKNKNDVLVNNGDTVIVQCKIQYYTKSGNLNALAFKISKLDEQDKTGIDAQYNENKKIYQEKGYFDRHRELPRFLFRLGVITSLEGAAIQDILYVLRNNGFIGKIIIKNCVAQGSLCPKSVAEGIKYFNDNKNVDVILITRGGGSFDDLYGFSDPQVIESIFNTELISISAVGHEIDFMLSDFVSDIRAPTPSVSAEMICTKQKKTINRLSELKDILTTEITNQLEFYKQKLTQIDSKLKGPNEYIIHVDNTLKDLSKYLMQEIESDIRGRQFKLKELNLKLDNCNFKNVLSKGYALILADNNEVVSNARMFDKSRKKLKIVFIDGERSINNLTNEAQKS